MFFIFRTFFDFRETSSFSSAKLVGRPADVDAGLTLLSTSNAGDGMQAVAVPGSSLLRVPLMPGTTSCVWDASRVIWRWPIAAC